MVTSESGREVVAVSKYFQPFTHFDYCGYLFRRQYCDFVHGDLGQLAATLGEQCAARFGDSIKFTRPSTFDVRRAISPESSSPRIVREMLAGSPPSWAARSLMDSGPYLAITASALRAD